MLYDRASEVCAWVFEDNATGMRSYSSLGFTPDGASKTLERGRPVKAVRLSRPLEGA